MQHRYEVCFRTGKKNAKAKTQYLPPTGKVLDNILARLMAVETATLRLNVLNKRRRRLERVYKRQCHCYKRPVH